MTDFCSRYFALSSQIGKFLRKKNLFANDNFIIVYNDVTNNLKTTLYSYNAAVLSTGRHS